MRRWTTTISTTFLLIGAALLAPRILPGARADESPPIDCEAWYAHYVMLTDQIRPFADARSAASEEQRAEAHRLFVADCEKVVGDPVVHSEDMEVLRCTLGAADAEIARGLMALGAEDDPLSVPGARVQDGKCKKVRLPGKGFERWEASWSAGTSEPIVREDPSTAIEAARRRACMVADDDARETTFMAVAHLWGDEKTRAWREGLGAAMEGLFACVAHGEPTLRGLDGAAEIPDSHGAYQCVAAAFSDTEAVTGVGWSTGLERAGEEALTEMVYSRRRVALGYGLRESARASAEVRLTLVALGYSSSMPVVANSDLADRGRLGCVGIPRGEALSLAWAPGSAEVVRSCGDRPLWPPVSDLASVAGLDEARDTLCRERAYYGIDLANRAVAAASPEHADVMARTGWGVALTCESDCMANTALLTNPEPVSLPGIPDRSNQGAAETLLLQAILLHDMDLLILAAPMFDEVAFRSGILERYPLSFWLRLPPLITHGLEEGELAWHQLGGQWVLMVAD